MDGDIVGVGGEEEGDGCGLRDGECVLGVGEEGWGARVAACGAAGPRTRDFGVVGQRRLGAGDCEGGTGEEGHGEGVARERQSGLCDDDGVGDVGFGVKAEQGLRGVDKGGLVGWLSGKLDAVARGGAEEIDGHEAQAIGDFGQRGGRRLAGCARSGDGELFVLEMARQQDPDGAGAGSCKGVLGVVRKRALHGATGKIPCEMVVLSISEKRRVPVEVERLEVLDDVGEGDPKGASHVLIWA